MHRSITLNFEADPSRYEVRWGRTTYHPGKVLGTFHIHGKMLDALNEAQGFMVRVRWDPVFRDQVLRRAGI